jgi:hypothetical protein
VVPCTSKGPSSESSVQRNEARAERDSLARQQRTGTQVTRSTDAAFDYDAVQVRATARVGFGFANPAGVVRLYDAA